ncbi:MAG TPA: hypothetical protein PK218_06770 [Flavobacterium sp.]|jgi:hypothetical protein|nr:hypothetical protein [Flavobacterium sp.]
MNDNQIKLEEAQKWAENWRNKQPDVVKAFLIPKEDIIALYESITLNGAQDVRGYLGIRETGEYKMMFVAVDTKGNDRIDLGIYDLTQPCPNFCDLESPLYDLKK